MGNKTIHSNDTVRQINLPDILQTILSLSLIISSSEDRPDKVLIDAAKKWYSKMLETDASCKLISWFDEDSNKD